jgi:hypothetical protein
MHSLDLLPAAAAKWEHPHHRLTTAGICWALRGREATRVILLRSVNLEGEEPGGKLPDNV